MSAVPHDEDRLLGAFVLGALDPEERIAIEAHLTDCADCLQQVAELKEVRAVLDGLPPEAMLQTPPDADLALQRALRQARAESTADRRRRTAIVATAAAVVLAAAVGVGTALGSRPATDGPPVAAPPSATSTPAPAGTRVGTIVDPATGVRLTAAVVPAAGWVRVNASVNGIAAGEDCRLIVVSRDGRREVAGGWVVSDTAAREGTNLDGSVSVPPDQVTAIEVRNIAGRVYATLPI
jgi:hypothetical protein